MSVFWRSPAPTGRDDIVSGEREPLNPAAESPERNSGTFGSIGSSRGHAPNTANSSSNTASSSASTTATTTTTSAPFSRSRSELRSTAVNSGTSTNSSSARRAQLKLSRSPAAGPRLDSAVGATSRGVSLSRGRTASSANPMVAERVGGNGLGANVVRGRQERSLSASSASFGPLRRTQTMAVGFGGTHNDGVGSSPPSFRQRWSLGGGDEDGAADSTDQGEDGEDTAHWETWKGTPPARRVERSSSARGSRGNKGGNGSNSSRSPGKSRRKIAQTLEEQEAMRQFALDMSVTFLEDALAYRDPDYMTGSESMRKYRLRVSRAWQTATAVAVSAYMAACFLGVPPFAANWEGMPAPTAMQDTLGQAWGLWLELGCVLFFSFDIYLLCGCRGARAMLTSWWECAFVVSLILSVLDIFTRWYTHRPWSRVFRPAVFFYVGPKVRDCSLSTLHAIKTLLPVLILELLVTLAYACVCVVLYHGVSEAPFTTLRDAYLSLFALSTTVNDPDVWMPLYHRNRASVFLFSSFLVVQVFLLHNILLASVWNEFGERMKIYARTKKKWRETSVRRAFDVLDLSGKGFLSREMVMVLLMKIRPHYDGSKRLMMFERIVHSVGGGGAGSRSGQMMDAAEVPKVPRRDFCNNVVEALSLKIRTMREKKIARAGEYMLLPLYVWNALFVLGTCAMSPWVFTSNIFWLALMPTSILLGASVMAEVVMTGVRAYLVLPWNCVKMVSMVFTMMGLLWFIVFTSPIEWFDIFTHRVRKSIDNVHLQVSIGLLMSARCIDLGTLLRNVSSIHSVVSIMYRITPSVFAQAGVIFTIFHLYAYLGMALYGGVITPDGDYGDTPFAYSPYYYENNFNSYPQGLVTLFELLIVNNWNMIITGYIHISALGNWTYLYFLSFITLAVSLALNVLTAIFMTAFTATSNKAHMTGLRGAGPLSQSMTSNSARTALGAGASLALRPSRGSLLMGSMSQSEYSRESGPESGTEITSPPLGLMKSNSVNAGSGKDHSNGGVDGGGAGGGVGSRVKLLWSLGSSLSNMGGIGRRMTDKRGGDNISDSQAGSTATKTTRDKDNASNSNAGTAASREAYDRLAMPPPPPVALSSPRLSRPSDPLRQSLLCASAVLPENEAVEDNELKRSDGMEARVGEGGGGAGGGGADLGWGGTADVAADGVMPPPPPPPPPLGTGGFSTRARWGSGHYYTVSRRNSYSDRDMFEAEMIEAQDDDENMTEKVVSAIAMGLGKTVGIRVCMLRHTESRTIPRGSITALGRQGSSEGVDSSDEDELEHPETRLLFENPVFRTMVLPHLPKQRGVELGAREDEGWEAVAMREELTDVMLHTAFGDAILKECPPPIMSPTPGSSRSVFPMMSSSPRQTPQNRNRRHRAGNSRSPAPGLNLRPPSPSAVGRERGDVGGGAGGGQSYSNSDDDEGLGDEDDDLDLPLDLGIRTWTKALSKGERSKRSGYRSKTAVLSIQCVLAARKPQPIVVYTAKIVQ